MVKGELCLFNFDLDLPAFFAEIDAYLSAWADFRVWEWDHRESSSETRALIRRPLR